jgi:hypothetical protein
MIPVTLEIAFAMQERRIRERLMSQTPVQTFTPVAVKPDELRRVPAHRQSYSLRVRAHANSISTRLKEQDAKH